MRLNWNVLVVFFTVGFVCDFSWAADVLLPQSGVRTSSGVRDDGALQKGIPLPVARFTDLGDGTVLDTLTSLIWMKNKDCFNSHPDWTSWSNALAKITDLNSGQTICANYSGHDTDWRLPSVNELQSLVDYGYWGLPFGHPFIGGHMMDHWSSTTDAGMTSNVWNVRINNGGGVVSSPKAGNAAFVWPVRGGQ